MKIIVPFDSLYWYRDILNILILNSSIFSVFLACFNVILTLKTYLFKMCPKASSI